MRFCQVGSWKSIPGREDGVGRGGRKRPPRKVCDNPSSIFTACTPGPGSEGGI